MAVTEGFTLCRALRDESGKLHDFLVLDANPSAERVNGLRREDFVGKTWRQLWPGAEQYWWDVCNRVMSTGEDVRYENYARVHDRWYDVHQFRVADDLLGTIFTDISERKRAEESLRGSEERYRVLTRLYAVLSRVNEVIVRTHDEQPLFEEVCRIVAEEGAFPLVWVGLVKDREIVSAASGGPASEYLRGIKVEIDGELGQGPTGTCVREDRPVINDDFGTNPSTEPWRAAALAHGFRASASFPLHRRGPAVGALTLYSAHPGAFTAEHIKLLGALAADVSYALEAIEVQRLRSGAEQALRESERTLRESDRRKNEFLGVLSHELRNPLAPIRNSIYILENADPAGEQAARARAVIQRQVEHLTRIVDDLLDVTRIGRGKIELKRSRVDLASMIRRAAEDHGALFHQRGIDLAVHAPGGPMWADVDPTRLAQVVGNLLNNAAKFTPRGGGVRLALEAVRGAAEVHVHDTGVGIEPDLLTHMFEPFVQAERTLARTDGGLGLGLALVKGITELHGGSVRAASAGPGQGAELVVRLPLTNGATEPDVLVRREASASARRVLVVDDNVDSAETLAQLIEIFGHAADVAHDGETAISMARATRPDVIFCDLGLPGMSGYDVVRSLRREDALRQTEIFAVSGYAQLEDRQRAADAGFDGHIAKPCDPEEIRRLLG